MNIYTKILSFVYSNLLNNLSELLCPNILSGVGVGVGGRVDVILKFGYRLCITSLPGICSDLAIVNIRGVYSQNCSQGRAYRNETTSFMNG